MSGAVIKFVQGASAPPAGQALQGVTGTAVVCSNQNDVGPPATTAWVWQIIDVPPGSAVPLGTFSTSATGTFTPDIVGGYLVKLTTTDSTGSFADLRAVLIPEDTVYNRIIAPFSAGGNALNIGGQTRGWAPFMETYLHVIDRLKDVGGAAPTNGQVLAWVSANNRYEPSASGGLTTLVGDVNGLASANHVDHLTGTGSVVTIPASTNLTVDQAHTGFVLSQAAKTSDAATVPFTIRGQYAFGTASGTNRLAGNVVVDIGPPTNGFTGAGSEAMFQLTRNGTVIAAMGANPAGTAQIALWLGTSAPTGTNAVLYGDGSLCYVNGPAGTLGLLINDSTFLLYGQATSVWLYGTSNANAKYYFDSSLTSIFHFGVSDTSAAIQYDAQTSNALPGTLTITGQFAFASATGANRLPGNVVVNLGAPTNSFSGQEAQFAVQRNGVPVGAIGPTWIAPGSQSAIWLLAGGNVATSTNAALYGDGSTFAYLNAAAGGNVGAFIQDSSPVWYGNASQLFFGGVNATAAPIYFGTGASALMHFGVAATSAGITYDAKTSDVAPVNLIITPQAPFASAVTNVDAGDVVINVPSSISGGTKYGGLQVQKGGVTILRMGIRASGSTFAALWAADGGSPSTGNYFIQSGAGETDINNATTIYLLIGNSTGTSMQLTSTLWKQTGVGSTFTSQVFTGSATITASQPRVLVKSTGTLTMVSPVSGQEWEVWIDTTINGADITLTIARFSTEKINGFAGSLVLPTYPNGTVSRIKIACMDGTNWNIN